MAQDDLKLRMLLENAGQDQPDRLCGGLHRIAPSWARKQREVFGVVLIIGLDNARVRYPGMKIDRDVQRFGARIDRPELRKVHELAVGQAMQNRSLEAELDYCALQFVGG